MVLATETTMPITAPCKYDQPIRAASRTIARSRKKTGSAVMARCRRSHGCVERRNVAARVAAADDQRQGDATIGKTRRADSSAGRARPLQSPERNDAAQQFSYFPS